VTEARNDSATDPLLDPRGSGSGEGGIRGCYDASPYLSIKHATYFGVYDDLLASYRGRPITFVEIGVLNGGSLHMWRRFLGAEARIIGVDLNPAAARWEADGFEIVIGDQGEPAFWEQFFAAVGPIDVLLDDGGHTNRQQVVTAVSALPHVRDGGLLIVEDVHASYQPEFGNPARHSFMRFALQVAEWLQSRFPGVPSPQSATGRLVRDTVHRVLFHESIVSFHVDRSRCVINSPTTNHGTTLDAADFRLRDARSAWLRRVAGEHGPLRRIPLVGAFIRRLSPHVHRWRQRRETAALARYFA
jgi:hypothetical protein